MDVAEISSFEVQQSEKKQVSQKIGDYGGSIIDFQQKANRPKHTQRLQSERQRKHKSSNSQNKLHKRYSIFQKRQMFGILGQNQSQIKQYLKLKIDGWQFKQRCCKNQRLEDGSLKFKQNFVFLSSRRRLRND